MVMIFMPVFTRIRPTVRHSRMSGIMITSSVVHFTGLMVVISSSVPLIREFTVPIRRLGRSVVWRRWFSGPVMVYIQID